MELRFEPKFYREHLGEKSDHKSLIQDFQPTRPEGYGLTRYLQDQAFVDEEFGNIRTYLIRQKGTGELVGYYSIRAGNILLRQNESTNVISGIELTNFALTPPTIEIVGFLGGSCKAHHHAACQVASYAVSHKKPRVWLSMSIQPLQVDQHTCLRSQFFECILL